MFLASYLIIILLFIPSLTTAQKPMLVEFAEKKVVLRGYTRNLKSATISSEVSGKVLRVNYDVGQAIGQEPFMEVDSTFIDLEISNALKSIERVNTDIKKSISRVEYLEKEYERIKNLFQDDLATESQENSALQNLDQSRLELELKSDQKEIHQTTLSNLRERKKRHTISAPEGWIITERKVEVGEIIQPGTALAEAADYGNLTVPLTVTNEELESIESLSDIFDAFIEGNSVRAKINWINPAFDEKTRKRNVELIISNYKGIHRGGLQFTLAIMIKAKGLQIPKAAVTDRYQNPTITLKDNQETIQLIIIGETDDYMIISEDDRILPGSELLPARNKATTPKDQ